MSRGRPRRTVERGGYAKYMRSAGWRAVKARYRASGMPQACIVCGSEKFDLHHRSYRNLGNEKLTDLVPLCRVHHDRVHQFQHQTGKELWLATKVATKSMRTTERRVVGALERLGPRTTRVYRQAGKTGKAKAQMVEVAREVFVTTAPSHTSAATVDRPATVDPGSEVSLEDGDGRGPRGRAW